MSDGVFFPAWLPRFNRLVTNPIQGLWAWLLPPWAVIVHRGRRSGRVYKTPVAASVDGDVLVVTLPYGDRTDWVRNLLAAGHGRVMRAGRTLRLTDPEVYAIGAAPADLPVAGRLANRYMKVLTARVSTQNPR